MRAPCLCAPLRSEAFLEDLDPPRPAAAPRILRPGLGASALGCIGLWLIAALAVI